MGVGVGVGGGHGAWARGVGRGHGAWAWGVGMGHGAWARGRGWRARDGPRVPRSLRAPSAVRAAIATARGEHVLARL